MDKSSKYVLKDVKFKRTYRVLYKALKIIRNREGVKIIWKASVIDGRELDSKYRCCLRKTHSPPHHITPHHITGKGEKDNSKINTSIRKGWPSMEETKRTPKELIAAHVLLKSIAAWALTFFEFLKESIVFFAQGCIKIICEGIGQLIYQVFRFDRPEEKSLYDISYCFLGIGGILITVVVSSLVSLFTGRSVVKPSYICPFR